MGSNMFAYLILSGVAGLQGFYEEKVDIKTHQVIERKYVKEPQSLSRYFVDPGTGRVYFEVKQNPNYVSPWGKGDG